MKRNSIGTKIFLSSFTLIISVLFLIVILIYTFLPIFYEQFKAVTLQNAANELFIQLQDAPYYEYQEIIDESVVQNNYKIDVYVLDSNGKEQIVYSKDPFGNQNNHIPSQGDFDVDDAIDGNAEIPDQTTDISKTITRDYTAGGTTVYFDFTTYMTSVAELQRSLRSIFPLMLLVVALMTAIISYVFSRVVAAPIIKLSKKAKQFSNLNFDIEKEDYGKDEIGDLNRDLDQMSIQLKIAIDKLNHDVEMAQSLERERRSQLAVMSHELKTPLTILKGQTELMLANVGKYKDRDYYLNESMNKIEKMQSLIQDMLLTSDMDSMEVIREGNDFNLIEEMNKIIDELSNLKDIKIDFNYDEQLSLKNMNSNIFNQVLKNLIENAIKYTEDNKVGITLENEVLTISNKNTMIQEEEIDKLFEPFVRLEKSRNSNKGGHGLGLYIIKKGLDLHNIKYEFTTDGEIVSFVIFL